MFKYSIPTVLAENKPDCSPSPALTRNPFPPCAPAPPDVNAGPPSAVLHGGRATDPAPTTNSDPATLPQQRILRLRRCHLLIQGRTNTFPPRLPPATTPRHSSPKTTASRHRISATRGSSRNIWSVMPAIVVDEVRSAISFFILIYSSMHAWRNRLRVFRIYRPSPATEISSSAAAR